MASYSGPTTSNIGLRTPGTGLAFNVEDHQNWNMTKLDTIIGAFSSGSSTGASLVEYIKNTDMIHSHGASGSSFADAIEGISCGYITTANKTTISTIIDLASAKKDTMENNSASVFFVRTDTGTSLQVILVMGRGGSSQNWGGIAIPFYGSSLPFYFRCQGNSSYWVRLLA